MHMFLKWCWRFLALVKLCSWGFVFYSVCHGTNWSVFIQMTHTITCLSLNYFITHPKSKKKSEWAERGIIIFMKGIPEVHPTMADKNISMPLGPSAPHTGCIVAYVISVGYFYDFIVYFPLMFSNCQQIETTQGCMNCCQNAHGFTMYYMNRQIDTWHMHIAI